MDCHQTGFATHQYQGAHYLLSHAPRKTMGTKTCTGLSNLPCALREHHTPVNIWKKKLESKKVMFAKTASTLSSLWSVLPTAERGPVVIVDEKLTRTSRGKGPKFC